MRGFASKNISESNLSVKIGALEGGLIDLGPRQNFADLAKKVDDISDLAKYFPKFLDLANNHQKTYPQIFIALGTPEAIKIALQETSFEFSLKADVSFCIPIWDKTVFFFSNNCKRDLL